MRERIEEDRAAMSVAECEAVALGFLDDHYRADPIDPDDLIAALVDTVPAARELWSPAGIGGHPDHVQVRAAALALAADGGPPVRLYADLPYAVRHGWPAWVTRRRNRTGIDHDAWWATFLPGGEMPAATRHVLSRAEMRRKLHALAAYRTQWVALDGVSRQLSRRDVIRYEVSFTPASTASRSGPPLQRRAAAP
jgi:LmbE family N-acetylglucosaminyl deacetylase